MKITSFNPLIVSPDAASLVSLFEDLGFERKHTSDVPTTNKVTNYTFKDAAGHCVDVSDAATLEKDMTIIRMNVDDFDEAYDMLTARGFKNPKGGKEHAIVTDTNISILMVSPSGFGFDLCHHKK